MQKMKKVLSFVLALLMLVGVFTPMTVMAVNEEKVSTAADAVTQTVTLHKLMMSKDVLNDWQSPEKYDGTQDFDALKGLMTGKTFSEIKDVYFALKFAADYKEPGSATVSEKAGKFVKAISQENKLTPTASLEATTEINEAVGGLTKESGITFSTSLLKGNFEIVEVHEKSTYVGNSGEAITDSKAVPVEITLPLINSDGTVLNAHVYPKNTEEKPKIDKDFKEANSNEGAKPDGARADKNTPKDHQVGDTINYDIKTVIPAKAKYATAVWDDKMTEGLTLNENLFVVKVGDNTTLTKGDSEDYTLTFSDNGFVLKFTAKGLEKINDKDSETTVQITYSATLNGKAVVDVPESNDVTFHYGNNPGHGNTPVPTKPEQGKITVTKTMTGVDWPTDGIKVKLVNANTGKDVNADTGKDTDVENEAIVTLTSLKQSKTWENLDKDTQYKVVEITKGYQVTYGKGDTAGTLTIKNEKQVNPEPLNPTEPKVVTYGKKFVKTDDKDKMDATRLAGAEFYVYKKETDGAKKYLALKDKETAEGEAAAYETADKLYHKAIADFNAEVAKKDYNNKNVKITVGQDDVTGEDNIKNKIAQLKDDRDAKFLAAREKYQWLDDNKQNKEKALVLTSDDQGRFEITGLAAGTYFLEEKTAPVGYAKIADQEFTVGEKTYAGTNDGIRYNKDDKTPDTQGGYAQQVKNKKVTIPQTGGIGTVIFTVGGLALMGGATFALKRNKEEEEN